jgi:hypothetical protein
MIAAELKADNIKFNPQFEPLTAQVAAAFVPFFDKRACAITGSSPHP